jgi:hypothetical protein
VPISTADSLGSERSAVVPGTQRLPGRPQTTLARVGLDISGVWADRASLHDEATLGQRLMPNHFESAFPAGSAIAFDSVSTREPLRTILFALFLQPACHLGAREMSYPCQAVWHTSVENTSGRDRCGAHFSYASSGRQGNTQEWGATAGLSEETLRRLDREGKLGVVRRRILGLPDEGTG